MYLNQNNILIIFNQIIKNRNQVFYLMFNKNNKLFHINNNNQYIIITDMKYQHQKIYLKKIIIIIMI
jgi:hypothetical protein